MQRGRLPVLDVHAHLDEPRAREVEPESTDAREPTAGLADDGGHFARGLEPAFEVDVERNERATRADEHRAGGLVQALGPEIWLQLTGVDPALQLLRAASPEERGPAPGCELAVEEDGQPELAADPLREVCRRRLRPGHVVGDDRHDRNDVRGSDTRMRSLVTAQVDPVPGTGDSGDEGVHEIGLLADEREHRAVVVDVGVDVE